jgi:hypothetical protein
MNETTEPLTDADKARIAAIIESLYTGELRLAGLRPVKTGAPGYNKSAIEAAVGVGKRYVTALPSGGAAYYFRVTGHVRRLFKPTNGGPARVVVTGVGGTLHQYRRG